MKQSELLNKYLVRPVKFLGQHFLVDDNIVRNIVDHLAPKPGETLLEIGPGLGALTVRLLEQKARVVGVEKDRKLCVVLKQELSAYQDRLKLIQGDILSFRFRKHFKNKKVRVVGNLPYYLTTPLIFHLIDESSNIRSALLMMQKEVAGRLLAMPGSPEYGRLTVAVRFFADVKREIDVSRHSFLPAPNVDSTVVVFEFHSVSVLKRTGVNPKLFLDVVKTAFSQRRKNILNCLAHSSLAPLKKDEWNRLLLEIGIDPHLRSEVLFLKDFVALCRKLQEHAKGDH